MTIFLVKIAYFALSNKNASICIRMHQYASKCIRMLLNTCRMNFTNMLCMKFQFEKFNFFWLKMTNFFVSAQNASICIRTHQNVCKMNCANVLYMKSSKKLLLLHLQGPKLTKYICLFMVVHPVVM